MNLVADEGVEKQIVEALRAAGMNVRYFAEEAPGSDDTVVLAAANDARSLLLTCDKDFGELVFRQQLASAGVVLIRLAGLALESKARVTTETLQAHSSEMFGAFSVIAPGSLRIRSRQMTAG